MVNFQGLLVNPCFSTYINYTMNKKYKLLMMLSLIAIALGAQTPEQHYFEWTQLPFTKEELSQRREKLIDHLQERGATGLVVVPASDGISSGETFRQNDDFYYFTGLELPNSILVIDIDLKSAKVYVPETDPRFYSASRPNDFPGRPLLYDMAIASRSGLPLADIDAFSERMDQVAIAKTKIWIDKGKPGTIGLVPSDYFTIPSPEDLLIHALLSRHPDLQIENSYDIVARLRMVKSREEIKLLRKATTINVDAIKIAAKSIKAGVDERFLEGVLEGSYKMNGAQRLAFGSIIKSGPNALWPWRILATHYDRRNRAMADGDLVIFDVGCEYDQYVSDVGRTFPVSGTFDQKQRETLRMEVAIADSILAHIKPGIRFSDLKALTDRIIPDEVKPFMQVALHFGHHLGLSTGDPSLPEAPLEVGMVFTVEPWYYNHDAQIAVFTEDVVLVTENGCEILSKALPRSPEALEKLMKAE